MKETFFITTGIPYVNARPHLGHVLEWFQVDALARYHTLLGEEVRLTTGADENSLKNVQAAEKAKKPLQEWLDEYAAIFQQTFSELGIEVTDFRRGSDQKLHWPGVQKLWQLCDAAGDIYKKSYQGLYCIGCESFYTPEELIDGKCPEHLTTPELIMEENYFFRLSNYQDRLQHLIESDKLHIVSEQYKQEMLGFLKQGLEDFSISRYAERSRGTGVPVPNDTTQVMYVWFDALAIYMTAIGWGYDQKQWEKFWPADVHVIGKGINRFHSIYWIAILLSAQLPTPKMISVHGYVTANGQKMSKSLGNVIEPLALTKEYGVEPIRYYLLKEIPAHSDGDFSFDRFREVYTADLANGLGNLCSRVAKLCEKSELLTEIIKNFSFDTEYSAYFKLCETELAAKHVLAMIAAADKYLSEEKPWTQTGHEQAATLHEAVRRILSIAYHLQPFMPHTAETILTHFNQTNIKSLPPLFPRLPDAI
ncbi:MAG: methionine--tRNA ligase [bacterium]|nr:methionine--tRNA ligase [bacterium]